MRKRFFKAAGLSIFIGLIAAFLFAVPMIEKLYSDETEKQLDTVLSLIVGYPLPEDSDHPYQEIAHKAVSQLDEQNNDLRITIIDENGTVLGDSIADPAGMVNHVDRPEVKQALQTGKGQDVRRSSTVGNKEMYRAVLQTMPDGSRVVYRASLMLKSVNQARMLLWECGLIGIFMGFIVALAAANYSAGRIVRPLQQLTCAVRQLAEGSGAVHVEEAPDEMGELSSAFNRMSERLTAAHAELEQSNERLANILQGMEDGVVALDTDGRVALLTRRARELLGPSPQDATRLADCGTNYSYIQNILDRVAAGESPLRETIELAGTPERILQVYAVQVSSPAGGTLAVLSDVTRMRKLETMRSEFVANVTHEFKTPLTSIRGYMELLKSGPRDEETTKSFYEIIEIEAERLQKLTDDLLQLSEIENGAHAAETGSANVLETASSIAESLRPEADERKVKICINIPDDLRVVASPHRLHQLLKNLMENAVKYNREGGLVTVSAGMERGVAVIRVQDTGIGISSEHIGRIFERFYRVDKGRSRETGGTGLGLSIVKHIVSLYGGDIRVESTPNKGSTFIVRFHCA